MNSKVAWMAAVEEERRGKSISTAGGGAPGAEDALDRRRYPWARPTNPAGPLVSCDVLPFVAFHPAPVSQDTCTYIVRALTCMTNASPFNGHDVAE